MEWLKKGFQRAIVVKSTQLQNKTDTANNSFELTKKKPVNILYAINHRYRYKTSTMSTLNLS